MEQVRFSHVAAGALVALLLALVWWLDRHHSQAGLIALVLLTLTTGFLHGALDAVILLRQIRPAGRAFLWALIYFVAVVLLGLVFAPHAGTALILLLLLSVWHFGEPFDETSDTPNIENARSRVICRFVLGGAPVMLPALTSASQLNSPSVNWIQLNDSWVWPAWAALAWIWLALLIVWAIVYARKNWRASRSTLAEVAVLAVLNLLLTPLMAFALYFGLYHAPVHIRRVARATAVRHIAVNPLALLTLLATLLLGAGLLAWRGVDFHADVAALPMSQAVYVEWLVVSLLALTVPHLVLISYFAPWLARQHENII